MQFVYIDYGYIFPLIFALLAANCFLDEFYSLAKFCAFCFALCAFPWQRLLWAKAIHWGFKSRFGKPTKCDYRIVIASNGHFKHVPIWHGHRMPRHHPHLDRLESWIKHWRDLGKLSRFWGMRFVLGLVHFRGYRGRIGDLASAHSATIKLWCFPLLIGYDQAGYYVTADLGLSNPDQGRWIYHGPIEAMHPDPFKKHQATLDKLLGAPCSIDWGPLPKSVLVQRIIQLPAVIPQERTAHPHEFAVARDILSDEQITINVLRFLHILIAGMSQFGKSNLLHIIIRNLLSFPVETVARLYLIDLKGGVEFARYNGADRRIEVAWRFEDVFAIIRKLHRIMEKRFDTMIANRWERWHGTRAFLIIDEMAKLVSAPIVIPVEIEAIQDHDERNKAIRRYIGEQKLLREQASSMLDLLSMQAAGVGIIIIASAQYPTSDAMAQSFRANFGTKFHFRAEHLTKAAQVLGSTKDLPRKPTKLERGRAIYIGPNADEPRYVQVFGAGS